MTIVSSRVFALRETLRLVRNRPFRFLWTVLLVAVTSALLMVLGTLALWFDSWTQAAAFEASVFVTPGTAKREIEALKADLQRRPEIATVEWLARDAALRSLAQRDGSSYLASLKTNPLPDVLSVAFAQQQTPATVEATVAAIGKLPGVDTVAADLNWQRRLAADVEAAEKTAALIGGLVLSVIGLGWWMASALLASVPRKDVALMLLMGADTRFIARPYAYLIGLAFFIGGTVGAGLWSAPIDFLDWIRAGSESLDQLPDLTASVQFVWAVPVATGLVGWSVGGLIGRRLVSRTRL